MLPLDLWDDSDLEGKLAVIAAIEGNRPLPFYSFMSQYIFDTLEKGKLKPCISKDGLDDLDLQAAAMAESSGPAFPSVDHLQDSDDKIAEAVERGRRLGEAATNELSCKLVILSTLMMYDCTYTCAYNMLPTFRMSFLYLVHRSVQTE